MQGYGVLRSPRAIGGNMKKIKRVYVAGAITPYKSEHPVMGFLGNIKRGVRASLEVLLAGLVPFSPFLDFQYWLYLQGNENITEKMIKDLSIAWLEVSDAVLVLPKWRKSDGTKAEIARAKELDIPVFYQLEDIVDYNSEI